MKRWEVINAFIEERGYEKYLEIGVDNGECFERVQCESKLGVDPHASYKTKVNKETSDEFFARNEDTFDIIFIDGLHIAEQVEKDIRNASKILNSGGMILVHDCLPRAEEYAGEEFTGGEWYGTVWKAAPNLVDYVLDTDCGIGVIEDELKEKEYKVTWENHRDLMEVRNVESEEQKVYKIFIGIPAYKWPIDPHTAASIRAANDHPGLECTTAAVIGDAHIERARASVLKDYLTKGEFDYFLNVDWDIEFDANQLYQACCRELDAIGGPYAFKTREENKSGQAVFRAVEDAKPTEDHLVEAMYLGGGFTLLSDKLVRELCDAYRDELGFNLNPDLDKEQTQTVALWNPIIIEREDWGEGMRELLSEDYSLCARITEIGYKMWLDLKVVLNHWDGDKCYKLPTSEVKNDG